ncbi:MAG: class II aldolase/adducin family protein [Planctomycetes bacterium]|nr:class II aldolase/adducin family protein [Planctomycetota bacterium]
MDYWNEEYLKTEMIEIGKTLYDRGYIAATDGNISVRLENGDIFMTPSGVPKGRMRARQIVRTDSEGRVIGEGKPSSEILMHLAVYGQRKDARAVVHAHPPYATAFSIAGVSLAQCVIPEIVVQMGTIPTAPYATPSTPELPESIRRFLSCSDALVLERHGTLTLGDSLLSAYHKLEKVEHTAHITLIANQLGGVKTLSPEEVHKLMEVRRKMGLTSTNTLLCENCSMAGTCHLDLDRIREG